jgi:hypothetical protein
MNASNHFRVVAVLATALLSSATVAAAGATAALEEKMSHDGLQKTEIKGIDLAYVRPGATLAGYGKVKLDPVEVAFARNWNPERTGSRLKLTATERENIRSSTARLVHEEFVKELQRKSKYTIVSEAGPDVLRVKVNIVNLYVTAPDTGTVRASSYALSAGEMTLVAELFDSESGQVIARLVDRSDARFPGSKMMYTDSVINSVEFRAIAQTWARILRDGLDKAHGIGSQ